MTNVKRVLIYRLGSLGDTLVALPALHLVARAFPDAERRMLTNFPVNVKAPPAAAILEHTGLVHGFLRYAVGTRDPRELMALWWQLRQWRPEVLIYLGPPARRIEEVKRDSTFFRLCGVRRVIGAPLTEEVRQHRWDEDEQVFEPEASRLTRSIQELGDARLDAPESWDLHLTPNEQARAAECLAGAGELPVIAVSVGTKVQSKDWGRENWRALLSCIAGSYPGHALALAGAAEEAEASEFAAEEWRGAGGGPVVNLCRQTDSSRERRCFRACTGFCGA